MTGGVLPTVANSTPLWSRKMRLALWVLVLVGAAAFILGASGAHPQRAWQSYLVNYLFWTGLAVTGAIFVAIWRVTNSVWGERLLGAALTTLGFLPVSLLLFLPLVVGRAYIFLWLGHPKPNRTAWLDPTFLFARDFLSLLLLYALCAAYAYYLLRPALGRQKSGGLRGLLVHSWRGAEAERSHADHVLRRMTPPLIILYALVFSLIAFDLVMSLDQRFYSTLFGGYYFMTNLYMGLAFFAVLLGIWLEREPKLSAVITANELHQLGKLTLGFNMLYGLVFWSQYLVIWYGNLSHEIPFVYRRQHEQPWATLSYAEVLISLLVPFCILLSRTIKKNPRTLAALGLLILAGMWLERYVLVVPSLWQVGQADRRSLPLGWPELAITVGFAAAMLLCCGAFARAFPITLRVVVPETGRALGHKSE